MKTSTSALSFFLFFLSLTGSSQARHIANIYRHEDVPSRQSISQFTTRGDLEEFLTDVRARDLYDTLSEHIHVKRQQKQMSKSGLAAMKRLEDSKKAAAAPAAAPAKNAPAGKATGAAPATGAAAKPGQTADEKRLAAFRTKSQEAHDNQMKLDATKEKGSLGRFASYSKTVKNPSLEKEEKKKPAFKPETGYGDGKKVHWYSKVGQAVAHPLRTISDHKIKAQESKLKFEKQFETKQKVDFQTAQNEFHGKEAGRRKDHWTKQQGDMTSLNHAMRYPNAVNQGAMAIKNTAALGALRRRAIDEELEYLRVKRSVQVLDLYDEFDLE